MGIHLKRYRHNKLLMTIAVLFCTLNIVTVLIGSLGCIYILNHFHALTARYNSLTFQQTKSQIDTTTTNAQEAADDIVQNTYTTMLMDMDAIVSPESLYLGSQLISAIRFCKNSDSNIQGIFVYLPESDKVISDTGMYDAQFFYNNIFPNRDQSFDQWKEEMTHRRQNGFESQKLDFGTYTNSVIAYYEPFNIYSAQYSSCAVVILDAEMLKRQLENMNLFSSTNVVMTYGDSNAPMLEIGNSDINRIARNSQLRLGNNTVQSHRYGTLVVQLEKSLKGDWTYWVTIPEHQYYDKVYAVVKWMAVCTFLQMLIGFLLALVFSGKSYQPIHKLKNALVDMTSGPQSLSIEDDLKIIEKVTSQTLSENSQYREELDKAEPILYQKFLDGLLRGSAFTMEYVGRHNFQIRNSFQYDGYVVGKVFIEDCSLFITNQSISEMQLAKIAISNILSEILNQSFLTHCVDYDLNAIMLIFNVPWTSDAARLKDVCGRLFQSIKMAQDVLVEACGIYTSVGVSSMVRDIASLNQCAAQAQEALNCKLISGLYSVNFYGDRTPSECLYFYTIQDEEYIVNHIKAGDYAVARDLLDRIFQKNQVFFQHNSVEMGRCLMYDMISTVLKIKTDLGIDDRELNDMVEKTLKCQTINGMRDNIYKIYEVISGRVNLNKKSHNVQLKNGIIEYIGGHYADNSISLVSVAEEFHLNPSYLSVFFKEQVGDTFINYVLRLRMEKACRLLRNTKENLQTIAEKIGYANSGVFIRVFKKQYGYTPGQYRDNASLWNAANPND